MWGWIKHFEADRTYWKKARVKFDRSLGTLKGLLGAKLKTATGPANGVPGV